MTIPCRCRSVVATSPSTTKACSTARAGTRPSRAGGGPTSTCSARSRRFGASAKLGLHPLAQRFPRRARERRRPARRGCPRLGCLVTEPTVSGTELPDRARVVIIGGGVIGASVAYHLTKLGWTDVVLLERDQLTSGTTWHAAGLVVSGGMTTETLAWMTKYSTDLYGVLEDETGLSTGFRAVGYLQTVSNSERLGKLRREANFLRLIGIDREEVSAREVADLWPHVDPTDVLGGFFTASEGRADPYNVAMSLAAGGACGWRADRPGCTGHRDRGARWTCCRGRDGVWPDRGRVRRELRRDVGAAGRCVGRRGRTAPGDRARVPDHRAVRGRLARPSDLRGPGPVRLLPRGDRRSHGRSLRAGGGAVVDRSDPRRFQFRRDPVGLGSARPVPRVRDGDPAGTRRRRRPQALHGPGELHAGQRFPDGGGTRTRRVLRRGRVQLARDPHRWR